MPACAPICTRPSRTNRFGALLFVTAALFACLAFSGCAAAHVPDVEYESPKAPAAETEAPSASAPSEPPSTQSPSPEQTVDEKAAKFVADMTLEQKAAQLFVVTPEAITGVDTATRAGSATESALAAYPVGGIVYFQKNLADPDQTKALIANSQTYSQKSSGLPLFIAVDEEGGTVTRIANNPGFAVEDVGDMAAIGATGDPAQANAAAATVGSYLSDLGFNLNLAPDADICGDPGADVMALRSFGNDPQAVSSMVAAQVEGFEGAGVLCSAKHFPGIGGVTGDSHEGAIVSNKTLDDLRAWELKPFEAAIAADVPFVMVGHLSLPEAFGNDTPASITKAAVTDLLRDELGFGNIIITDAMEMGAVGEYCTADQAGVAALEAGVDMVLMPADFAAAYQGVLDAVHDGALPNRASTNRSSAS